MRTVAATAAEGERGKKRARAKVRSRALSHRPNARANRIGSWLIRARAFALDGFNAYRRRRQWRRWQRR